jgi:copper homeostasis protein (lipoprotein)
MIAFWFFGSIGCGSTPVTGSSSQSEGHEQLVAASPTFPGDLPASFEGELPCADCQGVFYHLDLLDKGSFFLRTTRLGYAVGAVSDAIGSWQVSGDRRRLTLFGGWEAPMVFRIVDNGALRKLDAEGREVSSDGRHDLEREPDAMLIEPRLTMRGMYRYMADAALFVECESGRRFPVAMEADNLALERAYLDARKEPGQALLVSLQGRLALRPAMEGDVHEIAVIPERFLGVSPGETCGARASVSELENNYWKLISLGDRPAPVLEGRREPHLVFHSEDGRVTGTGGCNQLNGGYEIDGDSISFGRMASTMMACADGKDADRALLAALETAETFRKTAHHLELVDGEGNVVARFEARELQ